MNILLDLPCHQTDCAEKVLARPAFCYGCDRGLCQTHLDGLAHKDCREIEWDRPFEDALKDLDIEALRDQLRLLRPDHTVTEITMPNITEIPEECHGGLNIHIPILFDDGIKWKLRLNGYTRDHPPFEVSKYIRESEAATMTALQSVTGLVARIHKWGVGILSKTNDPRCLFIIFDYMNGEPSEEMFYELESHTKESKAKFIEGYADYSIKVASLSYDSIGSLKFGQGEGPNNITVGPLVDLYGISGIEALHFPGPFNTMRDRYIHQIDRVLDCTRKGLVGRARPLLVYLSHLVARELVIGCSEFAQVEDAFYIRQPDALTGQFLCHENEITAVLDWEFANTTCKTHAFSAIEAIFGSKDWLHGDNAITEGELLLCQAYEERGRPDLAQCVKSGRKYQRLEYVIGNTRFFMYDEPTGDSYVLGILNGLVGAFQEEKAVSLPTTKEAWIKWALSRHVDDPGLPAVMALEETSALYRSKEDLDEPIEVSDNAAERVEPALPIALTAQ